MSKAKQRRASRLNIERQHRRDIRSNLAENSEDSELHDLIHWKDSSQYDDVCADDIAVGQIVVERFGEEDEEEVRRFLSEICLKLSESLNERLRTSDLIKVAQDVLAGSYDWFDNDDLDAAKIDRMMSQLVEKMGLEWDEKWHFNHDDVFLGYVRWINLVKSCRQLDDTICTEKLWKKYCAKYKEELDGTHGSASVVFGDIGLKVQVTRGQKVKLRYNSFYRTSRSLNMI